MSAQDARGEINFFRIPVDENSYSLLKIGSKEFPVHLSYDNLTDYENFFVNWHKQKEIEISIVTDGALHVCLPGYSEVYYAGDVFIIFPDVLHAIRKAEQEACEYRTLLFSPEFLYGYPKSYWDAAFYRPLISSGTSIAAFRKGSCEMSGTELDTIFTNNTENMNAMQKMQLQHSLQSVWIKLFNLEHDAGHDLQQKETFINDILIYLHRHYPERFSLDDLAAEVKLSRSECCRKFRKNMGMTMMEYLTEYRIGRAMDLLEHSAITITEIAVNTGFSSASSFSEHFRKKAGLTPLQYRKSKNPKLQ